MLRRLLLLLCWLSVACSQTEVVHRSNCEVCHLPRDENDQIHGIEEAHPGVELSCTDCHGGNAWVCDGTLGGSDAAPSCDGEWVYDKAQAHVDPDGTAYLKNLSSEELDAIYANNPDYLRFINPGDLRVQAVTCGKCHAEAANSVPYSAMGHTAAELTVARSRAGIQLTTEDVFGAINLLDEDFANAEECAVEQVERFLPAAFEYQEADLETGRVVAEAQEQYLAKNCQRCHLSDFGENRHQGDFRSSGCSACHMKYSNDGLSRSEDPRINKQTVPHPETHALVAAAPVEQCAHCHFNGGRIGISFQGYRESAGPGLNPASPEPLGETLHGQSPAFYLVDEDANNNWDETPPDVHFEAGMHCVDCHLASEVHGSGHLQPNAQCAVKTQCEDCHGSVREHATITSARPALTERDGKFFLHTKVTNLDLEVPQVKDSVTEGHERYSAVAALGMGIDANGFSHTDQVECYTCHASWTPSCYGCHVEIDFTKSDRYQTDGRVLPGVTTESRGWVQLNDLVLMHKSSGKLAASMPSERFFMTVLGVDGSDENGDPLPTSVRSSPRTFTTADGRVIPGFGQRAFDPHTTRKRSQFMACDRCHSVGDVDAPDNAVLLDITAGFGSQRFPQLGCDILNEDQSCNPGDDFTTYQLDAIQTREGESLVALTDSALTSSARPLTLAEIEAMRRVVVPADAPLRTEIPDNAASDPTWPAAQRVE